MKIFVKRPEDCSKEELDKFHDLLLSGGQVLPDGLRERIRQCKFLGLCYIDNEIVGVSAIKQPDELKTKRILKKAKIEKTNIPKLELGYSVTTEEFRRQGINQSMNNRLLDKLESNANIYATTNNDTMRKYLSSRGFKKLGDSFEGRENPSLDYYEK